MLYFLIGNPHFLSLKLTVREEQQSLLEVMDQDLLDDFSENRVSVPLKNTNNLKSHSGEKSNKCNQCDYVSSQASYLRSHLKTHSLKIRTNLWKRTVEKSKKCYRCDLFGQAILGHIRKRTVEKNQTNATKVTLPVKIQALWGNIW